MLAEEKIKKDKLNTKMVKKHQGIFNTVLMKKVRICAFDIYLLVINFKLGPFIIPTEGNLKAVFIGKTRVGLQPFNPDLQMQEELERLGHDRFRFCDIEDSETIKFIGDYSFESNFLYTDSHLELLLVLRDNN